MTTYNVITVEIASLLLHRYSNAGSCTFSIDQAIKLTK